MLTGKLKVIELTDKPWDKRWLPLIERSSELGLSENIQADVKMCDIENLKIQVQEVLASDYDICFFAPAFAREMLKCISQTTHEATKLGACDILIRDKSGWWPRPALDEAFTKALTKHFGQIDFDSHALVTGTNGFSLMVISALAKLGFTKINVSDSSREEGEALVKDIKTKYFNIEFNFIPFQAITTLPGVHSLFVNCIPLTLENEMLDELYFFNFLKSKGVVIDLNLLPAATPLILEAKQWGARHLSGEAIMAERDALVISRVLRKKISVEIYTSQLRAAVDAVPFDASAILKRFRERGE